MDGNATLRAFRTSTAGKRSSQTTAGGRRWYFSGTRGAGSVSRCLRTSRRWSPNVRPGARARHRLHRDARGECRSGPALNRAPRSSVRGGSRVRRHGHAFSSARRPRWDGLGTDRRRRFRRARPRPGPTNQRHVLMSNGGWPVRDDTGRPGSRVTEYGSGGGGSKRSIGVSEGLGARGEPGHPTAY